MKQRKFIIEVNERLTNITQDIMINELKQLLGHGQITSYHLQEIHTTTISQQGVTAT
jgi:hypothetical protein